MVNLFDVTQADTLPPIALQESSIGVCCHGLFMGVACMGAACYESADMVLRKVVNRNVAAHSEDSRQPI